MDTAHPTLLLGVIFILMLINVFFAMAETALTESHKSRLEKLVSLVVLTAHKAPENVHKFWWSSCGTFS